MDLDGNGREWCSTEIYIRATVVFVYANDYPQALSNSHAYLYADDTTICHQRNYVLEIENILNKKYVKACNWFVDNKQGKKLPEFSTTYHNNRIKQHHTVEYFSCNLDANLSEESVAMKPLRKVSTKLQFLHSQNEFLTPKLRWLRCNSLIQSHFGYACVSWHCLVGQKMRKKNTGSLK